MQRIGHQIRSILTSFAPLKLTKYMICCDMTTQTKLSRGILNDFDVSDQIFCERKRDWQLNRLLSLKQHQDQILSATFQLLRPAKVFVSRYRQASSPRHVIKYSNKNEDPQTTGETTAMQECAKQIVSLFHFFRKPSKWPPKNCILDHIKNKLARPVAIRYHCDLFAEPIFYPKLLLRSTIHGPRPCILRISKHASHKYGVINFVHIADRI